VVVAGLIHASIRDPLRLHADIRSEKLAILDQWRGVAASAAFGSSHVHNGFDPRAFDATLAGTPLQTRSINLAIAGGSQSEQRVTALEYVRHMRPPAKIDAGSEPRTCMVLLELNAGANFTNDHLVHPRAINIYDLATVRFEMSLTKPGMSLSQRVGRVGYALAAAALHYVNLGMLSNAIFLPPVDKHELADETEDDKRGLLSMFAIPSVAPKIEAMAADHPPRPAVDTGTLLPGNSELLDELERAASVRNLQMAYVVMPRLSDRTAYPMYPDSLEYSGGMAPIINLGRPDLYPELYQAKYWLDGSHLNGDGSAVATTLLAKDLERWYAAHGAPPQCGG
jgi:hypothetical protein